MTPAEASRRVGASRAALSRWLSGKLRAMSVSTAKRMAVVLGVRVEYLLGLDDRMLPLQPTPTNRPEARLLLWLRSNVKKERRLVSRIGRTEQWLNRCLSGEVCITPVDREVIREACSKAAGRHVEMSELFELEGTDVDAN